MEKNDIQNNIYYYQNLLDEGYYQKKLIEQQIDELWQLGHKLVGLKNEFDNTQLTRNSKLSMMTKKKNMPKSVVWYCAGMGNLLNGQEYSRASSGLDTAKYYVDVKRQKLEERLNEVTSCIFNYQNQIDNWRYQLQIFKEPQSN